VKVTKRRLRQIIKEVAGVNLLNNETGEHLYFADDDEYGMPNAPEEALWNVMKRLGISQASSSPGYQADMDNLTLDLSGEDWEDVHAEIEGKRSYRKNKKERERFDEKEGKGLWDNVHAKRKRGEKPAKKGEDGYPDEKSWKAAQESEYASENLVSERGTGNPVIQAEERALMNAVVEFSDVYMLTMGMNPGDPADAKRVRRTIDDMIDSVIGDILR